MLGDVFVDRKKRLLIPKILKKTLKKGLTVSKKSVIIVPLVRYFRGFFGKKLPEKSGSLFNKINALCKEVVGLK